MARNAADKIYSATYSNVPVYEYNINGNHVMRRRSDDWINATHILKVAGYDKPTRTRILEREVQKGTHEKVQGGYGKYQGTWISLEDGRDLAHKNGVLDQLLPIFNFIPGDRTPPPAPKHITAASNKPRAPRAPVQPRRQLAYGQMRTEYEHLDPRIRDEVTPENMDLYSESGYGDYEAIPSSNARKRRRVEETQSQADREHRLWAEELLDYFMLQEIPYDTSNPAPTPPDHVDLNRPIDDKGHTALHWAAAMGDVEIVKDLIRRGASIEAQSKVGETPLMRVVLFTNNFDRAVMEKVAPLLIRTVDMQEWVAGSTVFHYVANSTKRKSKYACARYYMECLLNKMAEFLSPDAVERILNATDANGDTAITIAARHGARKCVRSLIARNAAVDVVNNIGETADQFIVQLNNRRQERMNTHRQLSSSPMPVDNHNLEPALGGAVRLPNGLPFGVNVSRAAANSTKNDASELYKSESALTLTSQVIPAFYDKTKALAETLEAELCEKDAEFFEAERLTTMRRAELEELKTKKEELRQRELEQTAGGAEYDDLLREELEKLERECEEMISKSEDSRLFEVISRERQNAATAAADASDDEGDSLNPEELLRTKLELARQLVAAFHHRKELVKTIVQAAGLADVNGHHENYYKLLGGCLNMREEDIQTVIPEIFDELQQYRELEMKGA